MQPCARVKSRPNTRAERSYQFIVFDWTPQDDSNIPITVRKRCQTGEVPRTGRTAITSRSLNLSDSFSSSRCLAIVGDLFQGRRVTLGVPVTANEAQEFYKVPP